MKTAVTSLIVIVACLFLYLHQRPGGSLATVLTQGEVSAGRTTIPQGHQYTPEGVYFLRADYSFPAPAGLSQWPRGQQLFADQANQTAAPAGTRAVTDGVHAATVPSNMLSEDAQEAESLRRAMGQAQARGNKLQSASASPSAPNFGHTALDQPAMFKSARHHRHGNVPIYEPTPPAQ